MEIDTRRLVMPLFAAGAVGVCAVGELIVEPCDKGRAVELNGIWHSRLPYAQKGPWMYAFWARGGGVVYAVALWHNPSARTLPGDWIELRRMAIAGDAPRNTASYMLSRMIRWFRENTDHPHAISYQDTTVHLGTIYKASNWEREYVSKARVRDRSKLRVGTDRAYRSNSNGAAVDGSEKIRWGIDI
jgi:hypothetical protein